MKNTIKIFCAIYFLLHANNSYGQHNIKVPETFKETILPVAWSDEWYKLNNSKNEYQVSVADGKLEVSKYNSNETCEIKTPDGKIIGIDVGEWGGKLFFVPAENAKKSFIIKNGNIKFIFSYRDKIYFIEGLLHMIISQGALFELDISSDTINYKRILDFDDDAPQSYAVYKDKIFVAGHKNFYIINDLRKEVIFENTFWGSLHPNSIAVFNNENVFVGITGGIVKLDLTQKSQTFYKNN